MTAERITQYEFEVDPEELALLLAAPIETDVRRITDPIAVFGTKPVERLHVPAPPLVNA
jgi:hypothetical protein